MNSLYQGQSAYNHFFSWMSKPLATSQASKKITSLLQTDDVFLGKKIVNKLYFDPPYTFSISKSPFKKLQTILNLPDFDSLTSYNNSDLGTYFLDKHSTDENPLSYQDKFGFSRFGIKDFLTGVPIIDSLLRQAIFSSNPVTPIKKYQINGYYEAFANDMLNLIYEKIKSKFNISQDLAKTLVKVLTLGFRLNDTDPANFPLQFSIKDGSQKNIKLFINLFYKEEPNPHDVKLSHLYLCPPGFGDLTYNIASN